MDPLGVRMKRERERQNMTLEDAATATKIGIRMLRAMEEEHFDQLPGGIFNKGFVRSYAQQLGMDGDQAVSDYLAETGANQPRPEPQVDLASIAARAEESRTKKRGDGELPWDKLAALLLLVALGFAVWGWRSRKTVHERTAVQAAPPAAAQESAARQQSAPPPQNATLQPVTPTAPAPVAPSSEPVPAQATSAEHAAGTPASFTVTIQARDDCWLKATSDGNDTLNEMLHAGQKAALSAQREIVLKAGNVGALDLTFNGVHLPRQGAVDEVKTLRFGPDGVQPVTDKSKGMD